MLTGVYEGVAGFDGFQFGLLFPLTSGADEVSTRQGFEMNLSQMKD